MIARTIDNAYMRMNTVRSLILGLHFATRNYALGRALQIHVFEASSPPES